MRLFGPVVVEKLSPRLASLPAVAVGAQGDPVEHIVIAASHSRDTMIKLKIDWANGFRIAVRVGAPAALPRP